MRPIDVFIQGEGLADIMVASTAPHHSLAEVLAALEHPILKEEGFLVFIEDVPVPLDPETIVEELLPLATADDAILVPLRLHVSHCHHIDVSVRFNGEDAKRRFPPSTTIARVHHWAARRAFHLAPRDAAEHVLQLQGSTKRPDRDVHLGSLTDRKICAVAFDLVPRKRVEG
ncbi:MAG: hypothetical protein KGJ49_01515 [Alphaproteobacteria bacterium]|nr:hypothetical protein [Alphaproteobacteria bacterium]